MDIMELGAIGELVGGVAVIATLIYLAIQIRQGNRAGSREAYRAWVSQFNRAVLEPQSNPEFMELFQKANRDWDSISARDQGVVNSVYSAILMLCHETFAQRETGSIHDHLSLHFDMTLASMIQLPGMATWYERFGKHFGSPSFSAHLKTLLESGHAPPLHTMAPWYVGETHSAEVA